MNISPCGNWLKPLRTGASVFVSAIDPIVPSAGERVSTRNADARRIARLISARYPTTRTTTKQNEQRYSSTVFVYPSASLGHSSPSKRIIRGREGERSARVRRNHFAAGFRAASNWRTIEIARLDTTKPERSPRTRTY